ncbi:MAG: MFS transporter [Bryobacterales bacterium]|jgi:MFS family permease|nr:MFS transporter [Bryobacterales bacterium]
MSTTREDLAPPHEPAAPAGRPTRSALTLIFATIFLDLLGVGILVPVIPFLVRRFESDALTVGLLALSFSAAQFLAAPILGVLSDRYGRRPVLLLSLLGSAFGYFLFGWAGALWIMFLGRIIDGFTGGNISAAQAYIADISPPEDRAKNFGLVGAAFGLGFIIGPALGGVLAKISLAAPAYGSGVLALVTMAFGYFRLPESLRPEDRTTKPLLPSDLNPLTHFFRALQRSDLWPILVAFFAINFAFSGMQTNFAVYTADKLGMGPEANAAVFAYIGVMAVLMQAVIVRKLSKRYSDRNLAAVGITIMVCGFGATAWAHDLFTLYVACTLTPIGSGLTTPTLTSLISKLVTAREQGWALGASQSAASLARIAGPVWAGWVYDRISQGAPYWTGAIWMVLALAVVLLAIRPAAGKASEVHG